MSVPFLYMNDYAEIADYFVIAPALNE